MNYYSTDERKGKVVGALAAFLYIVIGVVIMLLTTFKVEQQIAEEQGIMMDLIGDPGDSPSANMVASTQTSVESQPQEEVVTQDHDDDAPAVPPKPKPTTKPKPKPKPQEKPRTADPNALFRPSTTNNAGGATASTNAGTGNGGYGGDATGTGGGGVDSQYSVGNRSLVGSLPFPANYGKNKQGKVVVEIYVDEQGRVNQATYRARGSTTTDSELVRVALEAARKARFSKGQNDMPEMGTIIYTFSLR